MIAAARPPPRKALAPPPPIGGATRSSHSRIWRKSANSSVTARSSSATAPSIWSTWATSFTSRTRAPWAISWSSPSPPTSTSPRNARSRCARIFEPARWPRSRSSTTSPSSTSRLRSPPSTRSGRMYTSRDRNIPTCCSTRRRTFRTRRHWSKAMAAAFISLRAKRSPPPSCRTSCSRRPRPRRTTPCFATIA